ncbi:Rieske 2Fe-2S domain-containing protein [Thermogemmatispora tikiterensis]|uniref:(2Fe-2S)-binding protein n=1 Tax=Thermogemmatispora tikiterensis TaxID=1825093 RepID=A0A328VF39_9CHLR|nr:Rieske 2Fe-2S domain-containing protein [Thermogemmatispora tikiterensis]RAQ94153.1 (2Fe-2S)-binding protein [Thermogemmatispora tikiterensis]
MPMDEATLTWIEVATLDELWEGEMLEVEVDGQPVLLMHLSGGEIVAFQGVCPHQEYPLVEGELDLDTETLTCSGHHWQFHARSGCGINPEGCTLYRYSVRLDGSTILIGYPTGSESRQRYHRCREE